MTRFAWARMFAAAAVGLVVFSTPARSAASGDSPADTGVLGIQVTGGAGTTDGTCVLVRSERREAGIVQYFLTAAHLFSPALVGDQSAESLRIRLLLADGSFIETSGSHAVFPSGVEAGVDVAVIRVVVAKTRLVPVPMWLDSPQVGDVFLIRGPASRLSTVTTEHVRFRSTRMVIGDRPAAEVTGLLGAPAIAERGLFGVTTSFANNRVPVVTLLSAARAFLDRAIPSPVPAPKPTFHIDRRSIDGPLLTVACDATSTGELDVPVPLAAGERIASAEAHFTDPRSVRLGDLTVLSLEEKSVKLRFTLTGMPPPMFPAPVPCPQGQALVTVGVDIVVVPRH